LTCEIRPHAERALGIDSKTARLRRRCAEDLRPRSHRGRMEKARLLQAYSVDFAKGTILPNPHSGYVGCWSCASILIATWGATPDRIEILREDVVGCC